MITINNVLVATDFGEASDSALRYGRELAGRFGATLHVLHVAENVYVTTFGAETYAAIVPEMQQEIENAATKRLAEAVIDSDSSGPRDQDRRADVQLGPPTPSSITRAITTSISSSWGRTAAARWRTS